MEGKKVNGVHATVKAGTGRGRPLYFPSERQSEETANRLYYLRRFSVIRKNHTVSGKLRPYLAPSSRRPGEREHFPLSHSARNAT